MMSVSEYASDVGKNVKDILSCHITNPVRFNEGIK